MNKGLTILIILLVVLGGSVTVALSQDEHVIPQLPGQLAYVGDDFNIYSLNLNHESPQPVALTEDATPFRRYQWPTWSRDGRLAFFCCEGRFALTFSAETYISSDGLQPGKKVYDANNEAVLYAAWSPQACDDGARCLDLAVLINDLTQRQLFVELVRNSDDLPSNATVATGQPFYYSWSPNGERLVFHRNESGIDFYDIVASQIQSSDITMSGLFQTPAWSPVDDRVLFGSEGSESDTTDLAIFAENNVRTLVESLEGMVAFSWSPDGNYVAYRQRTANRFSKIFVLDAVSGELVGESTLDGVLAFFWSPDSQKLAYITLSIPPGTFSADAGSSMQPVAYAQSVPGLAWSVMNVSDQSNQRYSAFRPTAEMLYLIAYFDQFAASHPLWSPDSRYLVYGELSGDNDSDAVISILDVSQPDNVPFTIASGLFATWSFE